jgi:hypothetical protein
LSDPDDLADADLHESILRYTPRQRLVCTGGQHGWPMRRGRSGVLHRMVRPIVFAEPPRVGDFGNNPDKAPPGSAIGSTHRRQPLRGEVCLRYATLRDTNLERADLTQADLRGSSLRDATAAHVNLEGPMRARSAIRLGRRRRAVTVRTKRHRTRAALVRGSRQSVGSHHVCRIPANQVSAQGRELLSLDTMRGAIGPIVPPDRHAAAESGEPQRSGVAAPAQADDDAIARCMPKPPWNVNHQGIA